MSSGRLNHMNRLYGAARVQVKGQVTIPKKAREEFNLKRGDVVVFELRNGMLVIKMKA